MKYTQQPQFIIQKYEKVIKWFFFFWDSLSWQIWKEHMGTQYSLLSQNLQGFDFPSSTVAFTVLSRSAKFKYHPRLAMTIKNYKNIMAITAHFHDILVCLFPSWTFSRWALIAIRYSDIYLKGLCDIFCACRMLLPMTSWADNALWPLNVPLAFDVACCMLASKTPSIFIREISQTPGGELCGSSL